MRAKYHQEKYKKNFQKAKRLLWSSMSLNSIIIMLKQVNNQPQKLFPMSNKHQYVELQPLSTAPVELSQPLEDQNLFLLQSKEQGQPSKQLRPRSNSFRRSLKKKTPSEIIKDSILKNKQIKRASSLKTITSENLKLFVRIQEQKSAYKFTELHKELSCNILPVSRVNVSGRSRKENGEADRIRCASAVTSLKTQCDLLKQNLRSNQASSRSFKVFPSQEGSENVTQFFGSRVSEKVSINDKENIISNRLEKLSINRVKLNEKTQELILMKKLCTKLPPKDDNTNKYKLGEIANTNNIKVTLKLRPQAAKSIISRPNILVERPLQTNFL